MFNRILHKMTIPAILLIAISLIFTSCSTPIESADAYIEQLDEQGYRNCGWSGGIRKSDSITAYEVWVSLPFSSSASLSRNNIADIGGEVYEKLNSILKEDESISMITIFFRYSDGLSSNYVYANGKVIDMSDF